MLELFEGCIHDNAEVRNRIVVPLTREVASQHRKWEFHHITTWVGLGHLFPYIELRTDLAGVSVRLGLSLSFSFSFSPCNADS